MKPTLAHLVRDLVDSLDISIQVKIESKSKDPKTQPTNNGPAHNIRESLDLLEAIGFNGDDILELATIHTPERIKQVLQGIEASGSNVKNKPGYVRKALAGGWYKRRNHQ